MSVCGLPLRPCSDLVVAASAITSPSKPVNIMDMEIPTESSKVDARSLFAQTELGSYVLGLMEMVDSIEMKRMGNSSAKYFNRQRGVDVKEQAEASGAGSALPGTSREDVKNAFNSGQQASAERRQREAAQMEAATALRASDNQRISADDMGGIQSAKGMVASAPLPKDGEQLLVEYSPDNKRQRVVDFEHEDGSLHGANYKTLSRRECVERGLQPSADFLSMVSKVPVDGGSGNEQASGEDVRMADENGNIQGEYPKDKVDDTPVQSTVPSGEATQASAAVVVANDNAQVGQLLDKQITQNNDDFVLQRVQNALSNFVIGEEAKIAIAVLSFFNPRVRQLCNASGITFTNEEFRKASKLWVTNQCLLEKHGAELQKSKILHDANKLLEDIRTERRSKKLEGGVCPSDDPAMKKEYENLSKKEADAEKNVQQFAKDLYNLTIEIKEDRSTTRIAKRLRSARQVDIVEKKLVPNLTATLKPKLTKFDLSNLATYTDYAKKANDAIDKINAIADTDEQRRQEEEFYTQSDLHRKELARKADELKEANENLALWRDTQLSLSQRSKKIATELNVLQDDVKKLEAQIDDNEEEVVELKRKVTHVLADGQVAIYEQVARWQEQINEQANRRKRLINMVMEIEGKKAEIQVVSIEEGRAMEVVKRAVVSKTNRSKKARGKSSKLSTEDNKFYKKKKVEKDREILDGLESKDPESVKRARADVIAKKAYKKTMENVAALVNINTAIKNYESTKAERERTYTDELAKIDALQHAGSKRSKELKKEAELLLNRSVPSVSVVLKMKLLEAVKKHQDGLSDCQEDACRLDIDRLQKAVLDADEKARAVCAEAETVRKRALAIKNEVGIVGVLEDAYNASEASMTFYNEAIKKFKALAGRGSTIQVDGQEFINYELIANLLKKSNYLDGECSNANTALKKARDALTSRQELEDYKRYEALRDAISRLSQIKSEENACRLDIDRLQKAVSDADEKAGVMCAEAETVKRRVLAIRGELNRVLALDKEYNTSKESTTLYNEAIKKFKEVAGRGSTTKCAEVEGKEIMNYELIANLFQKSKDLDTECSNAKNALEKARDALASRKELDDYKRCAIKSEGEFGVDVSETLPEYEIADRIQKIHDDAINVLSSANAQAVQSKYDLNKKKNDEDAAHKKRIDDRTKKFRRPLIAGRSNKFTNWAVRSAPLLIDDDNQVQYIVNAVYPYEREAIQRAQFKSSIDAMIAQVKAGGFVPEMSLLSVGPAFRKRPQTKPITQKDDEPESMPPERQELSRVRDAFVEIANYASFTRGDDERPSHYLRLLCGLLKSQSKGSCTGNVPLECPGEFQGDLGIWDCIRKNEPVLFAKVARITKKWASVPLGMRAGCMPSSSDKAAALATAPYEKDGHSPRFPFVDRDTGEVMVETNSDAEINRLSGAETLDRRATPVVWVLIRRSDATFRVPVDDSFSAFRFAPDMSLFRSSTETLTHFQRASLEKNKTTEQALAYVMKYDATKFGEQPYYDVGPYDFSPATEEAMKDQNDQSIHISKLEADLSREISGRQQQLNQFPSETATSLSENLELQRLLQLQDKDKSKQKKLQIQYTRINGLQPEWGSGLQRNEDMLFTRAKNLVSSLERTIRVTYDRPQRNVASTGDVDGLFNPSSWNSDILKVQDVIKAFNTFIKDYYPWEPQAVTPEDAMRYVAWMVKLREQGYPHVSFGVPSMTFATHRPLAMNLFGQSMTEYIPAIVSVRFDHTRNYKYDIQGLPASFYLKAERQETVQQEGPGASINSERHAVGLMDLLDTALAEQALLQTGGSQSGAGTSKLAPTTQMTKKALPTSLRKGVLPIPKPDERIARDVQQLSELRVQEKALNLGLYSGSSNKAALASKILKLATDPKDPVIRVWYRYDEAWIEYADLLSEVPPQRAYDILAALNDPNGPSAARYVICLRYNERIGTSRKRRETTRTSIVLAQADLVPNDVVDRAEVLKRIEEGNYEVPNYIRPDTSVDESMEDEDEDEDEDEEMSDEEMSDEEMSDEEMSDEEDNETSDEDFQSFGGVFERVLAEYDPGPIRAPLLACGSCIAPVALAPVVVS